MKLSELDIKKADALADEQITKIVYGDFSDNGLSANAAILLGSYPSLCPERAEAAAELYRTGRTPYIVVSGGVEWEHEDGSIMSEAHYLAKLLMEMGVPSEAIILENEARTTKENMIYGTLQLNRVLKIQNVKTLFIVTSAYHLCRSLALAKTFMPRCIALLGYPSSNVDGSREHWNEYPQARENMMREIFLMKGLVDNGIIDDIEF